MELSSLNIEEAWNTVLYEEFQKEYFTKLIRFLQKEKADGQTYYPTDKAIFHAFNVTPWDEVKVVIIGQDPYHNPGEAMGLCFSVPRGVRVPPSLKNVFKELETDLDINIPEHGDLTAWATQGVFLLNAMLTVQHKSPGSHKKIGWQAFTNAVIQLLSEKKEGLVFLLWGNFAKSKRELIDTDKHLVLEAAHPSPLARGAYFGSKHFSKTNEYLLKNNIKPIDWQT